MTFRVALVLFPTFHIADLSILSVLETANQAVANTYAIDVVSMEGGLVHSVSGAGIATVAFDAGRYDTVIVGSTSGIPAYRRDLVERLRSAAEAARRVAGIGTGAFLLAEAGMLDGRTVTTHWRYVDALAQRCPALRVVPDKIYGREGHVWSSAGMTACVDLVLGMVEADLGHDVTRAICRTLVLHQRRAGGQSQFSVLPEPDPGQERIRSVLAYIKDNLHGMLTVDRLADHVNWSPRHFSRAFHLQTGMSPAKAIEKLRVEAAQALIESGHTSAARVASQTGFGDTERMRRAFVRVLGMPPRQVVRATARHIEWRTT